MEQKKTYPQNVIDALQLLDAHCKAFYDIHPIAHKYSHPIPNDTRAWSQILASVLSGVKGLAKKKGADLNDGSDVKGANCWEVIDTPRFNGVLPSGRKSETSKKELNVTALDNIPCIYFVLWDDEPETNNKRCRVWCVRTAKDKVFRSVSAKWYELKVSGEIRSDNFQLHPPRHKNSNIIRNTCGNIEMPLLFSATKKNGHFSCDYYDPHVIKNGQCKLVQDEKKKARK